MVRMSKLFSKEVEVELIKQCVSCWRTIWDCDTRYVHVAPLCWETECQCPCSALSHYWWCQWWPPPSRQECARHLTPLITRQLYHCYQEHSTAPTSTDKYQPEPAPHIVLIQFTCLSHFAIDILKDTL